ncbi:hypothetical protein NQ315_007094 [Exocentrus adspersus]|uniref:beta-glucosidase n=1 Tax=Exocentrus adspersus TaxID=1586481 RepID=A0AAV8WCM4_9CUCU|nr:hypothetical protein NQ315_007094 [Exocentrus adspersus]
MRRSGTCLAQDEVNNKPFPDDFLFGTATASYQVEGGWDEDGKGENIWDHLAHTHPELIDGNATGDVACDSYHRYKEDVALLKDLGANHYRFSLSWSRILPNGTSDNVNLAGVDYYKNLIKELRANDIEPLVTIYHWDLPQVLQEQGGWPDDFIVDAFADYARVCFELLGDSVKYWLTFNEPKQTCLQGYGDGSMAPMIQESGVLDYKCTHNVLKAHAKAWHIYDDEFRAKQNGKVSITIDTSWFEPVDDAPENEEAAETKRQFTFGWYVNPIFNGDYPEVMKTRIANRSAAEGLDESRLPAFTDEEIAYILGTHDYLGLNVYTSSLIRAIPEPEIGQPSYYSDIGVEESTSPDWPSSASSWLKITPWGARKLLNWIKKTYNDPDIFITENGVSEDGTDLNDNIRVNYYRDYLSNIRSAMEDGVSVIGYTAWSLMDNFEWMRGYTGSADDEINNKTFPDDFMFGVATSAFQVEGAWNEDGKEETIWDHLTHTRSDLVNDDGRNGDVACDSYHKYKEDVALMKDLGVDHYSFSLSWARILKNGTADRINEAGVDYYKDLIKELKDNGIEPIVTLNHFDLPQILEMQGGWIDSFIIETFADYARVCFELFGNDVKYWLTFNEPYRVCREGYGNGVMAPGIKRDGELEYKCAHNLLKAHARAWHIYDEEFRAKQQGKISITIGSNWYEALNGTEENERPAEQLRQFTFGWFAHPIIKGDYPEFVKFSVANRSAKEGRLHTRLPAFTEEEIAYIRGTYDFLGVTTFTSTMVKEPFEPFEVGSPHFQFDTEAQVLIWDAWPSSPSRWLRINPLGMRKLLNWIKTTYDNPTILIMGNGVSDDGSTLNDESRIDYYRDYLSNVRDAMDDGVNVIGYTAWSLLDNFEFYSAGYKERFGLYHVDFESQNRTRTPKSSVEYYKKVVSTHCLVESCVKE